METFEDEPSRKTLWVQTLHVFAWSLPLILNTRATTTRYDGFMGIAGCLPTFLLTVRGPYLPTAVESGFAGWSMTTDLFIVFVAALWLLFWLKYSRRIQYSWKGMVVLVVIWCLKPFHIILCGNEWATRLPMWRVSLIMIAGWIPLIMHNLLADAAMASSDSDPTLPVGPHRSGAPDPEDEHPSRGEERVTMAENLQSVHSTGILRQRLNVAADEDNESIGYSYEAVRSAVLKVGSTRFYQIGLQLGFTDDQTYSIISNHIRPVDKTLALLEQKVNEIGKERTKRILWEACKTIEPPIIGAVRSILEIDEGH